MIKRSELMERAAEILAQYGWTKRTLGDYESGFCLMGATYQALEENGHVTLPRLGVWPIYTWEVTGPEGVTVTPECQATPWMHENAIYGLSAIEPVIPGQIDVPIYNDFHLQSQQDAIDTLMDAAKYWRDRGE